MWHLHTSRRRKAIYVCDMFFFSIVRSVIIREGYRRSYSVIFMHNIFLQLKEDMCMR